MAQEGAELFADQALADVRVPVAVRPKRRGRIVDVQDAEPVEADPRVDLIHEPVELLPLGHVHSRHEEVARVEADPELRVRVEAVEERRQLVERAADRPARARRVLHQEPDPVAAEFEQLPHRAADALDARVEPGAEVGADVEHDCVGLDPAGDLDRVPERIDRLLVQLVVRAREVNEVEGVADHGADSGLGAALLEALEALRLVVRRPPGAGALREDLHRVAAEVLGPVDRRVNAARGGNVRAEEHPARLTLLGMSVRVRMAPSPTGFLHIGGVRTFLFNWLFARRHGGECLLRIENTDTSREVAEAAQQIQDSLRWLGIEWDGPVTFQLDRLEGCQAEARRVVEEGAAHEDEGAIRFRMPDEGSTAFDDLVLGRIEVENRQLEDLVLLRSDGRPTYNFASPVEDWLDR